jgi:hypothetical protein
MASTDVFFLADPLRTPLDWRTRLQVAIDIAAALVKKLLLLHNITLENSDNQIAAILLVADSVSEPYLVSGIPLLLLRPPGVPCLRRLRQRAHGRQLRRQGESETCSCSPAQCYTDISATVHNATI